MKTTLHLASLFLCAALLAQSPTPADITLAPATTGTINITALANVVRITPTGACTFNTTKFGINGDRLLFIITTSGTTSRVLTWGTNFKTAGTLATGTVTGKIFCVEFRCTNNTTWVEMDRTGAM